MPIPDVTLTLDADFSITAHYGTVPLEIAKVQQEVN